ncbi:MAG: phospholipid scramblase-related protein [Planctomycetaceae bacterium]
MGGFKQKLFSIGGAFDVLGESDQTLCSLKGKWTAWDFRFLAGDKELARVTKKWAGLGKELFTSADNYILEISDLVPPDNPLRQLILSSVFCIDLVLKE